MEPSKENQSELDSTTTPAPRAGSGFQRFVQIAIVLLIVAIAAGWYFSSPDQEEVDDDSVVKVTKSPTQKKGTDVNGKKTDSNSTDPKSTPTRAEEFPDAITNYFDENPPEKAEHPLDPCLAVAEKGRQYIAENIVDYTATMVKQERVGGKLSGESTLFCKIRQERTEDGKVVPFSVYIKYLSPKSVAGREAIWIKGENDNKLVAHDPNVPIIGATRWFKPDGFLAMMGNRYAITEIGVENLIKKMTEKGVRDRKYGECRVNIDREIFIDSRPCTEIRIIHPLKRDHFEFYSAKIYIDDSLNLPIRYESRSWPEKKGDVAPLQEQYTFTDLKINVGLTDLDFDIKNQEYGF